jgi:hypothetical protein
MLCIAFSYCPKIMRIAMASEIETLLEWQTRGMSARRAGFSKGANPHLHTEPANSGFCFAQWQLKFDAWLFGWSIEDSFVADDTYVAA